MHVFPFQRNQVTTLFKIPNSQNCPQHYNRNSWNSITVYKLSALRIPTRKYDYFQIRGARGVMVIVPGKGHDDTSSNSGLGCLHFTITFGKGMYQTVLPSAISK